MAKTPHLVSLRHSMYAAFALAAVLAIAVSMTFVPQSGAFTPANIPTALGATPQATAVLTHSPEKAKQGDTITYTGTYTVTLAEEGSPSYDVAVSIADPVNATFKGNPTAGDLKVSNGLVTGPTHTDGAWVYVVKTNDIKNFEATFTKDATVDQGADPGDLVMSSTNIKVTPTGPMNIQMEQKAAQVQYVGDVCTGYGEYVAEVPTTSLGSWLADIKFAYDPNKVTLDELPDMATLVANGKSGITGPANARKPEARNSITFENIAPNMVAAFEGGTVNPDDATPPWGPVSPTLSNLQFKDSINWKYDPSTWTGEAWVQPTTKITIHRGYTYRNCANNVATNGDPSRLNVMGLQFDNGRAAVDATAVSLDNLVLPGEKKPIEWCQDLFYTDLNKGGSPISPTVGKVKIVDGQVESSKNNLTQMTQSYGGLAIGEQYDQWVYYIKDRELRRKNLTTQVDEKVGTTGNTSRGSAYTPTLTSIAFDPSGTLWHMSPDGRLYYWNNGADGPAGDAQVGAYVERPTSYGQWNNRGSVQDIGFLKDGSLVFGTGYNRGSDRGNVVFTVDKSLLKSGRTSVGQANEWGVYPKLDYAILGIAFGPDGNLYASSGRTAIDASRNIYLLQKGGIAVPVDWNGNAQSQKGILGLTSCSFGPTDQPTPGVTGVQVRKVAYDPVTGVAAKAGTTTANKVTVKGDGTVTVRYGVIVTNVGDEAKDPGVVTDEFTAPEGFTVENISAVKLAGSVQEPTDFSASNMTFRPGTLAGGQTVAYVVTVDLKATSLADAARVNGECNTEGAGTPGGGFFNRVTMADDRDGDSNNDACIPIQPPTPGHLKLTKKIVDSEGREYGNPDADFPEGFNLNEELAKFQLTGAGFAADGSALTGVTGAADPATGVAVDKDVLPGSYQLSESLQGSSDYDYQKLEWTCEEGVLNKEDTSVTVPAGGNAACTITNTLYNTHVHVVKTATDKTEGNDHIGAPVNLKQVDGKGPYVGTLKYTITVTNDSKVPTTTGPITDTFRVPAGLKWQAGKDAKVTFAEVGGNATITVNGKQPAPVEQPAPGQPVKKVYSFTQDEFVQGAILANSVNNLGPAGSDSNTATFTIEIPVEEDTTPQGDNGDTVFINNREKLAECDADSTLDAEHPVVGTDLTKGAVNTVALEGESGKYTTVENMVTRDNIACIPVTKEFPAEWKVTKAAKDSAADGGFTGTGEASVGEKVTMTKLEDGTFQAVATYKVVATNTGKDAATAPAISDTPTLPAGFTMTGVTYQKVGEEKITAVQNPANGEAFTIPAGAADSAKIDPKGTVEYIVTVTGTITKEAIAAAEWNTTYGDNLNDKRPGLGECEVGAKGRPGTGFFNFVTVDGDEGDDGDNDSCVPIKPPATRVMIEKTDDTGVTRLEGAEFTIYKATCADGNCTTGEAVEGGNPLPKLTAELAKELPADTLIVRDSQGQPIEGADPYIGRHITPELAPGEFFYLQETKSPGGKDGANYSLLPEPVLFKVAAGGGAIAVNELGDPLPVADGTNIVNVADSFFFDGTKVSVHDPRMGELPKAGGMGHWTLAGGAGMLIIASLVMMFRTNPNGRRA